MVASVASAGAGTRAAARRPRVPATAGTPAPPRRRRCRRLDRSAAPRTFRCCMTPTPARPPTPTSASCPRAERPSTASDLEDGSPSPPGRCASTPYAGGVDDVVWGALTVTLTLLGGLYTWFAFRRRGFVAGLRGVGLTLIPVALL